MEENLEKIPLKLAAMLEEGVEFLRKKYSSESTELWEELTALEKLMDSFINQRQEELGRRQELFENLLEKHKTLLKDLLDFSQKSEETQVMLTDLEDLRRTQAKTIEDLEIKLASKEKKENLKAGSKMVKEELGGQSAESQEVTQSFTASQPSLLSLFNTDDEDEEEEEDVKKVKEEAQSPPSSPCSFSLLGTLPEEEMEELVVISSDSEADTDSELAMGEE